MKISIKLQDKIKVNICKNIFNGVVVGFGEYNGKSCIDFVDENKTNLFCYPSQIVSINNINIYE